MTHMTIAETSACIQQCLVPPTLFAPALLLSGYPLDAHFFFPGTVKPEDRLCRCGTVQTFIAFCVETGDVCYSLCCPGL